MLLLDVGGIHLDVEVLEHPVEVLVQLGGIELGPHEAAAMPSAESVAVGEGLEADPGRQGDDDGGDGGPPEEAAARVVRGRDGRLRGFGRVGHG